MFDCLDVWLGYDYTHNILFQSSPVTQRTITLHNTGFFYKQSLFSTQPQCCLTFSWIKLKMLLRCCLIHISNFFTYFGLVLLTKKGVNAYKLHRNKHVHQSKSHCHMTFTSWHSPPQEFPFNFATANLLFKHSFLFL